MRSRAAAVVLAASLLTSAGLLLPGPAAAARACVGVVVDARLAGGKLSARCVTGDPENGLAALTAAGHTYAFVPQFPGLVCSIDRAPECSRTSPDTYWSYWYRKPGSDSWTYSSAGAGNRDPEPGSTEAWVWQEGGRHEPPDIALAEICPQVTDSPKPKPSRTGDSAPPTSDAPATATSQPGEQSTRKPKPSGTETPESTGPSSPSTGAPASAAAPAPGVPVPSGTAIEATPAAAQRDDRDQGGSLAAMVAGSALVLLLGAAAVWRGRARRP